MFPFPSAMLLQQSTASTPYAAFNFNGTTGNLEMSSSAVLAYPLTVFAWIKPDASLGSTSAFAVGGIGTTATARTHLADASTGAGANTIGAASINAAGTTQTGAGPTNWSTGSWQSVAGVWSSATSRTAYFNGTAGVTNTNNNTTDLTTYTRTNFGARYNGSVLGSFFKGKMAYIAIWNVALTGAEITSLNGGALPTTIQAANLIFYPVWLGSSVVDQISGNSLSSTGITSDTDLPF